MANLATQTLIFLTASSLLVPASALAQGFDWGADCTSGEGAFDQFIPLKKTATIGEIPAGKTNVFIELTADKDVDVQLIDVATGFEVIAWPNGLMNGPTEECQTWKNVTYCYSGYNGGQDIGTYGNEWIEVRGTTNRELVMRAYGYAAGEAHVDYHWEAEATCGEKGDGSFSQFIPNKAVITVGDIPQDKWNVTIELIADNGEDVDVQLWDGDIALVVWPSGKLHGAKSETLEYQGMTITYSGYNGVDGNWGHETITIDGRVSRTLTMKAFGYAPGSATINYEWGVGVGQTCMGIATLQCAPGLACKSVQKDVSDPAGMCHTPNWCGDTATAPEDCSNLFHIAIPGFWTCADHLCHYDTAFTQPFCPVPTTWKYVGNSKQQCMLIKFKCDPGMVYFGNDCGCGCKPEEQ